MATRSEPRPPPLEAPTPLEVQPVRPAPEEAAGDRAYVVFYHRSGTTAVQVDDGKAVVIGRAWPSDVRIEDAGLSRQHARIWREGRTLHIEDLGSRNGTHVDGERVDRAQLAPGQRITLSDISATIQWLDPPHPIVPGLEPYDRFGELLAYEIERGRHLDRPVSLLMLRAGPARSEGSIDRWLGPVRDLLPPQDRLTVHDVRSVLALLPEVNEEMARRLAETIVAKVPGTLDLRVGIATAPGSATSHENLIARVKEAWLVTTEQRRVHAATSRTVLAQPVEDQLVIESDATRALHALMKRVAAADMPVLIVGETGTGKELLATGVHQHSARRSAPFRTINCGAIPPTLVESVLFGHEQGAFTGALRPKKGLFEDAAGGTVFLDEIGELSLSAQAALLRVLETRKVTRLGGTSEIPVDVRVLAATHRDLDRMVREGQFRLDLLFRLNAIVLEVPPLRDRIEELGPLADHFVRLAGERLGTRARRIGPDAMAMLESFDWPGNVRELRNVIERACVLAGDGPITAAELPEKIRRSSFREPDALEPPESERLTDALLPFKERVRLYETRVILGALETTGWSQSRAAELLKMPLRTLVHKIRAYGLKKRFDASTQDRHPSARREK